MVPFIQRSTHFLNTWLNSTCHKFSNANQTFTFFPENQCFKNKKIVFAHHCTEDMSTIIPHFYILVLILTLNICCKDNIGQDLYRGKVVCFDWRWAGGGGSCWKPADLVLYAIPVFENYPKSDLIQNKLKLASLGTDWIETSVLQKQAFSCPKLG